MPTILGMVGKFSILGILAIALHGCVNSGVVSGGSGTTNGDNRETPVREYNPDIGEDYIGSAYGRAKIEFREGIVKLSADAQTEEITVYLPSKGGTFNLKIINAGYQYIYLYGLSNGVNICNDSSINIRGKNATCVRVSGYDSTNKEKFVNEPMVKIDARNSMEGNFFNVKGEEGKKKSMEVLRIYHVADQSKGGDVILEDYFPSFNIYFNDITDVSSVSDAECPSYKDRAGNIYVPNSGVCIKLVLNDLDNVGVNHQYSSDGGHTWKPFSPSEKIKINISDISPGSSKTITLGIKEQIGIVNNKPVWDTIEYPLNVVKEANAGINAYCIDTLTNNTWQINNGDTCVFVDPKGNTGDLYFVRITYNDTGNCEIKVIKDGTLNNSINAPCNGLIYEHPINASEKGTGIHTLTFEIYKDYEGNSVMMDSLTMNYRVNVAPTFGMKDEGR